MKLEFIAKFFATGSPAFVAEGKKIARSRGSERQTFNQVDSAY